ncbi:MAG TPA: MAPEG family protein [Xanthobacteraceae bacterium]|nr:MAPEG family protein [Xanthobacteraceae bacterium]
MSLEMTLLIWSVALTFIQMLVAVSGAIVQVGLSELAGNREDLLPATGWAGRAQRAHRNMLESLVFFAVLILATEITNRNSAMTGFGAQLFFWARVAYAIVYLAGVPWVRTGVWSISMIGLILIFLQLV